MLFSLYNYRKFLKNQQISVLALPFFSPLARSPFSGSALNASPPSLA
jgi:hypothetical protein